VESTQGTVPRSSGGPGTLEGLIGKAIADLIRVRVGIWEKEARRRAGLAMEKFQAAGKSPQSQHELLKMAGACV